MKLIPHIELKVPMCAISFESPLFLASHDVDIVRPELCWLYYGPEGCFSMLICMLNNVLDMSRNVLLTISICRCVLFVWALCVSWLD
jgi:hypothetical protein